MDDDQVAAAEAQETEVSAAEQNEGDEPTSDSDETQDEGANPENPDAEGGEGEPEDGVGDDNAQTTQSKAGGAAKGSYGIPGSGPEPEFSNLNEGLQYRITQLNKTLTILEDLKMTYIFREGVNEPYYENWLRDSNNTFRAIIQSYHRLQRHRKRIGSDEVSVCWNMPEDENASASAPESEEADDAKEAEASSEEASEESPDAGEESSGDESAESEKEGSESEASETDTGEEAESA